MLIGQAPVAASEEVKTNVIVQRFDSALYVRTPWYRSALDKVVRLQIGAADPVDWVSEKLIPSSTPIASTISVFTTSGTVLRNAADESPPAHIDGVWIGGNHSTTPFYEISIAIDGTAITATRGDWTGQVLTITESYGLPMPASSSLKGSVVITRTFGPDGFCRYTYALTALTTLTLDYINGMQALKPVLANGQSLYLLVPGSNITDGVDISSEATQRLMPPSDWTDPNSPPHYFLQEVRQAGVAQWAYAMGFDTGVNRGTLTTAFERSAPGKFYPRGYEGNETLRAGERRTISGFFGAFNRIGN